MHYIRGAEIAIAAENPGGFYRTQSGGEGVRNWLKALPREDRDAIGQDLMRVQFRWPVGMPLCRSLGDSLWEVRSSLESNRIARLIFCFAQDRLVVLHGFVKKTRQTPATDLDLALRRKKEFEP